MDDQTQLKRTPLYDFHVSLGAKMVPFAGYDMPVQYPAGVLKEHLHTRTAAGLFDVSHMGQVELVAASGTYDDAAKALETLVPVDILGLKDGRQRYGFFTDNNGGILDDLMISKLGERLLIVVNAGCKDADIAHLRAKLPAGVQVLVHDDRALLALQGPKAEAVLAALNPDVTAMKFMDVRELSLGDIPALVSRTGLFRRGRFRDLGAGRSRHRTPRRCWTSRTASRSGSAPVIRCGSKPASASMATTSTRRRRLSKPRSNGASRRSAAWAAPAKAAFRVPSASSANWRMAFPAAASG